MHHNLNNSLSSSTFPTATYANVIPVFKKDSKTDKEDYKYCDDEDDELFLCMVDRRNAFSFISSRDHCQRSSPLRISDMPRAGFEPEQDLCSGFDE